MDESCTRYDDVSLVYRPVDVLCVACVLEGMLCVDINGDGLC